MTPFQYLRARVRAGFAAFFGLFTAMVVMILFGLLGWGLVTAGVFVLWGLGWALIAGAVPPILVAFVLYRGMSRAQQIAG